MSEDICDKPPQPVSAEVPKEAAGENGKTKEENNNTDKAAEQQPKISKNALKRQAKMEKWNATKAERRKREKAKRKAKRAQLREAGVPVPQLKLRKDQLVRQADSPCKVALVIDCDFAEYMTEMELKKLCKQINR